MSSSSETELASGRVNRAHSLRVVLVERPDNPPVVLDRVAGPGNHHHTAPPASGSHKGDEHPGA